MAPLSHDLVPLSEVLAVIERAASQWHHGTQKEVKYAAVLNLLKHEFSAPVQPAGGPDTVERVTAAIYESRNPGSKWPPGEGAIPKMIEAGWRKAGGVAVAAVGPVGRSEDSDPIPALLADEIEQQLDLAGLLAMTALPDEAAAVIREVLEAAALGATADKEAQR